MTKTKIITKNRNNTTVYYLYEDLLKFIIYENNISIAELGNIIKKGCSESITYRNLKLQKIGYRKYRKIHPNSTEIDCLINKLENAENIQTNEEQKVIDNIIDYMKKPDFLKPLSSNKVVRSYSIIMLPCVSYRLIFVKVAIMIEKFKGDIDSIMHHIPMIVWLGILFLYCGFSVAFFGYIVLIYFKLNYFVARKFFDNWLYSRGKKNKLLLFFWMLFAILNLFIFTNYSFNKSNFLDMIYFVIYLISLGIITYMGNNKINQE